VLTRILDPILHFHGWPVYAIVGLLVFAEAAIFLGFIFPGETAVLLGGVVASQGHVSLAVLIPVVVVCAIVGDSVGYFVGHRYGERLLDAKLLRKRRPALDAATELLRRRGSWTVFVGRFTAFLRAVVPGLAGLSRMHYRTFLIANAAGALVWGVTYTLIGYAVGSAYKKAEQYASWASWIVLGVVVVVIAVYVVRSRRRRRAEVADPEAAGDADGPRGDEAPAEGHPVESPPAAVPGSDRPPE
jgi:membrane protein DedA with SNARE-associated domain